MSIKPNGPSIHINLGNTLSIIWQLEEALNHFGKALLLNPDNEEAQLNFLSTRRMLDARKPSP